ncbi:MAG: hypothetical protein GX493_03845, partial [Firmicutes bacterium]|nr:hypothetical protein [Bacillota bacterium]
LIKRFYPIPAELVNWGGENLLEIRLYGEHATGISEPVFIRRASTEAEQRAIVAFDDEGAYLADLRNLPEADLEVEVFHDELRLEPGGQGLLHLRLRNIGSGLAFFIGLSLRGLDDAASLFFSDNYFALFPGQEKTVLVKVVNDRRRPGARRVWFEVHGWNVPKRKVEPVLELILN